VNSLVRPMTAADLQAVTELDSFSFKTPWPPGAFETELANAGARCWVAEAGGQVAAVLVLWRVLDEAHIATLAVHPEFRRRGIGSQLLQAGMDAAYAEGARIYHLEVRSGNALAQELYQGFSFEVVGRRPKYYKDTGEDAVLMTKVVE
jgi:[ribosomal protein S18]-alanine N-acetyltransferase